MNSIYLDTYVYMHMWAEAHIKVESNLVTPEGNSESALYTVRVE